MQVLTVAKQKNALRPAAALFLLVFEVYNKNSFILILFGWIAEIMDWLVAEGVQSKTGEDNFFLLFYFNFLSLVSCF